MGLITLSVLFRGIDEKCGGAYGKYGVCQRGMECVLIEEDADEIPFVGICKGKESCDKIELLLLAHFSNF